MFCFCGKPPWSRSTAISVPVPGARHRGWLANDRPAACCALSVRLAIAHSSLLELWRPCSSLDTSPKQDRVFGHAAPSSDPFEEGGGAACSTTSKGIDGASAPPVAAGGDNPEKASPAGFS